MGEVAAPDVVPRDVEKAAWSSFAEPCWAEFVPRPRYPAKGLLAAPNAGPADDAPRPVSAVVAAALFVVSVDAPLCCVLTSTRVTLLVELTGTELVATTLVCV